MKIWIIWTWYVWLIQAIWLAKLWFKVVSLDIDEKKIADLKNWIAVIYEPWLKELLVETKDKINFTTNYNELNFCDIIFIAVWTPQDKRWRTNKDFIHKASIQVRQNVEAWKVIVIKSTVPVGTNKEVAEILWEWFEVVSNPEFLREGKAIDDFFTPDRVIVWLWKNSKSETKQKIKKLYNYFIEKEIPFIETTWETAELIKYAANAFLATKISFINELSQLSDKVWANIQELANGIWLDNRIWKSFLNAGLGYWWSCFPKDVKSLIHQFEENALKWNIIKSVDNTNQSQLNYFLNKIENFYDDLSWKNLLVLWLAFKPNTDDLRESRAIALIEKLQEKNANIIWYDPLEKARENTKTFYPEINVTDDLEKIDYSKINWIIIATEYKSFNDLDWESIFKEISMPVIFDGRNILDEEKIKKIGFIYKKI